MIDNAATEITTDHLDYHLPSELIAQRPATERGASRLMSLTVGDPATDIARFDQAIFSNLRSDDLVVANSSRVLKARINVRRPTGGKAELLLLSPHPEPHTDPSVSRWQALARPARKLEPGMLLTPLSDQNPDTIRCVERLDSQTWLVDLPTNDEAVSEWLNQVGELPLPPYITGRDYSEDRYQTVYSQQAGSVAAPTAGLHFDEALWQQVRSHVQDVTHITLHVGAGTFLPVQDGPLRDHPMHSEYYEVSAESDRLIRAALNERRRVVAIGTTTARVLESVYGPSNLPLRGHTNIFITPGYRWGCVGALLTNFHLPKSTLIALVMSFFGQENTLHSYQKAIDEQMRFYSFGDAMFINGPALLNHRS